MSNQSVITKTHTSYAVSYERNTGYFVSSDYSKYNERLSMYYAGEIPYENVYGYEQALEHAEELRNYIYNGELINMGRNFVVKVITTTSTEIPINPTNLGVSMYVKKFFLEETPCLPDLWISNVKSLTDLQKRVFINEATTKIKENPDLEFVMSQVQKFIIQPAQGSADAKKWAAAVNVHGVCFTKKQARQFFNMVAKCREIINIKITTVK